MRLLNADQEGIAEAARLLREGRLVAFPTETVYGLGADAFSETALAALFCAKQRPPDNPLIVHIADIGDVVRVASDVSDDARRLMDAFWPGPLTLVLPRAECVPAMVSAGLSTVAVRLPDHPIARALIAAAGVPVAAPSANRSGRPSPTLAAHVIQDLADRIDAVVDGGACKVGVESTVVGLTGPKPVLLRPGGISLEAISRVLGQSVLPADPRTPSASPGVSHRHYTPRCEVVPFHADEPPSWTALDGALTLTVDLPQLAFARRAADLDAYARMLFAAFHDADAAGVKRLFVEWPPETGVGLAVRDRIRRAAG